MVENADVWREVLMQAGYAGLLLYLTFRIFKLLDKLVETIERIDVTIDVNANRIQPASAHKRAGEAVNPDSSA